MKNFENLINRLDRFHPNYNPVGMEFDWFDMEVSKNEEPVSLVRYRITGEKNVKSL